MTNEILTFVLSIGGIIITLSFTIIGFFLNRLVNDIKSALEEGGRNKGRIELVEQQQINDVRRIEERTQIELKALTENVGELSKNVNVLVIALAKKSISPE